MFFLYFLFEITLNKLDKNFFVKKNQICFTKKLILSKKKNFFTFQKSLEFIFSLFCQI